MAFARFAGFFSTIAAFLCAGQAHAVPKLEIQAIELVGYMDDALKIAVELPCGGSFYGLIAQEDRAGRTLRLAAAVTRGQILCTGMSKPLEMVVDYLATDGFDVVTPLPVGLKNNRLVIGRLSDVRRADAPDEGVAAVYETRCALPVGVLIRRVGERQLDLGIAERVGQGGAGGCDATPVVKHLKALSTDRQWKLGSLGERAVSLGRSFTLAVLPAAAVRRHPSQGLVVSFARACHEAPVGIVLGRRQPASRGGRSKVAVGVLVAQYPNAKCQQPGAAPIAGATELQTISDQALMLAPGDQAVPLHAENASIALRTPTRIKAGGTASGELQVSFLAACAPMPYTVFARDGRGRSAVAILTQEAAATARKCKNGPAEVSLSQPYAVLGMSAAAPFPLKLKGLVR